MGRPEKLQPVQGWQGLWAVRGEPRVLSLLPAPMGTLLPPALGPRDLEVPWGCAGQVPMGLAGGEDVGRVALGDLKLDLGLTNKRVSHVRFYWGEPRSALVPRMLHQPSCPGC